MILRNFLFLVAVVLLASAPPVFAQTDSGKLTRIIVPYAAGGASDVANRIMASRMSESLGYPVIVENRPGANANIGPTVVAQAAADGQTLLATSSFFTINPLVEKNLQWDPKRFVPVARFAVAPNVIVVPASSPFNSLKDLVAAAKAKPGMPVPEYGVGASQTIVKENLQDAAQVEFLAVQYKGGVSYVPDLLNGTLAMGIVPLNVGLGLIKADRLRALAITGRKRSDLLPEIPTLIESGYPSANAETWLGFHVPVGTPQLLVERLARAAKTASEADEVKTRFEKMGVLSAYLNSMDFEAFLREDKSGAESFVKLLQKK